MSIFTLSLQLIHDNSVTPPFSALNILSAEFSKRVVIENSGPKAAGETFDLRVWAMCTRPTEPSALAYASFASPNRDIKWRQSVGKGRALHRPGSTRVHGEKARCVGHLSRTSSVAICSSAVFPSNLQIFRPMPERCGDRKRHLRNIKVPARVPATRSDASTPGAGERPKSACVDHAMPSLKFDR